MSIAIGNKYYFNNILDGLNNLQPVSPISLFNKRLDADSHNVSLIENLVVSLLSEIKNKESQFFDSPLLLGVSGSDGAQGAEYFEDHPVNIRGQELIDNIEPGSIDAKVDIINAVPYLNNTNKRILGEVIERTISIEASTNGSAGVFLGDKEVGGYGVEFGSDGDVTGKLQVNNRNNVISIDEDNYVDHQMAIPLHPNVTVGKTTSTNPDKKDTYNVNVGPVQVDVVPSENLGPVIDYATEPELLEAGFGGERAYEY